MTIAYDISHHNGQNIKDLLSSEADKPTFLYIKKSEGISVDQSKYFFDLQNYAKEKGIITGGYHYVNPSLVAMQNETEKAAEKEAVRLVTIQDLTKLVPMMDVEEKYMVNNMYDTIEYLDKLCYIFFTTGGKKLGIYASYSMLYDERIMDIIKKYELVVWCARYKYSDAMLSANSCYDMIRRYLQFGVAGYPIAINQFCTKYLDNKANFWNLDCNYVFNPLALLQ